MKKENNISLEDILQLQKEYGFDEIQKHIDSGQCWLLEGSFGRKAMSLLESGACMLPNEFKKDYYGNTIPSREVIKDGTKGSLGNSKQFWQGVIDGRIEIDPLVSADDF